MKILAAFMLIACGATVFVCGMAWGKSHAPLQEYQIRLEMDSAYIYDGDRLVGSCKHGKDGIDSVLFIDNL